MNNTQNPQTREEKEKALRNLDLQFRDRLILKDGAAVTVVQELDGFVEVSGYSRKFIYRHEIRKHYPFIAGVRKDAKKSYERN